MAYKEAIESLPAQLRFDPDIQNAAALRRRGVFIVIGMGGSNLASGIISQLAPSQHIVTHRSYGLPHLSDAELAQSLIILSSYSGNTEETVEAFHQARAKKLSMVVLSTGGVLMELAKENAVPYIQIPDMGIDPRMALGYSIRAMLKVMGEEKLLVQIKKFAPSFAPNEFEKRGAAIARKLKGRVPVIYSSLDQQGVAYVWKIKLNETGKVPAFYNVFPELNHNEMNGFSSKKLVKKVAPNFHFLFLRDAADHERINKRMDVLAKMYRKLGLPVDFVELEGKNPIAKIFHAISLGDWVSYHIALANGQTPEGVPMVEEFKKLIK